MLELADAWRHPDWEQLTRRPLDRNAGRGGVMLLDHPRATLVARPYRHGGMRRLFLADYFRAGPRAAEEYRVHREAFDKGLATPEPVGWSRQPSKLPGLYHYTFYSVFLPDSRGLAAALREAHGLRRWSRPVADLLWHLYQCDIWHSDLNLNNWLIAAQRVWLIDFDRAVAPHHLTSADFLVKSLNRMARSAGKLGLRLSRFDQLRFVLDCCRAFGQEPRYILPRCKPPQADPGFFREIRWKIVGGHRKIG